MKLIKSFAGEIFVITIYVILAHTFDKKMNEKRSDNLSLTISKVISYFVQSLIFGENLSLRKSFTYGIESSITVLVTTKMVQRLYAIRDTHIQKNNDHSPYHKITLVIRIISAIIVFFTISYPIRALLVFKKDS